MRKDTDAAYSNFLRSGFLDSEIKKNENKGRTYNRIVKANKAAKAMGISYGKYMAGLWEKHARPPIEFGNFNKYANSNSKTQQNQTLKVLEGVDAAEYIRKLKVRAGTYEEPTAKPARDASGAEKEKAMLLNTKWSDAVKKLRENPEKVKNIKMVERKGRNRMTRRCQDEQSE